MTESTVPERWLPVVGWEGLYEVSDLGRVRSLVRMTKRGLRGGRMLNPKIHHKAGHLRVALSRENVVTTRTIHSLVIEAFVGPRPSGLEVRHRDGVPANNHLSNLTYGTRSENHLDRVRHGVHHQTQKTHCPQGHPYSGENLYWSPRGGRQCHTCRKLRKKSPQ